MTIDGRSMIGVRRAERHACTDQLHIPNCYNPTSRLTACCCGDEWWVGQVGTWYSRQLRGEGHETSTGRWVAGDLIGWDRYFLHTPACPDQRVDPEASHVCGGAVSMGYAEAVRAVQEGGGRAY